MAVPRISYEIEQADLKRFHLDEETTQRMLQADPYNSSTPAKTVLPSSSSSRGIICDHFFVSNRQGTDPSRQNSRIALCEFNKVTHVIALSRLYQD